MPAFDVIHVTENPVVFGQHEHEITVARLSGTRQSVSFRAGHDYSAPTGYISVVRETEASKLLRKWQDAGSRGFEGLLDAYDALIMSLGDSIMDDAKWPDDFRVLADLAEECGILPDLQDEARALTSGDAKTLERIEKADRRHRNGD